MPNARGQYPHVNFNASLCDGAGFSLRLKKYINLLLGVPQNRQFQGQTNASGGTSFQCYGIASLPEPLGKSRNKSRWTSALFGQK
jgi:hypothetical protein